MPAFTEDTPRGKVVIQDIDLTLPVLYSADFIAAMDEDEQSKVANFINDRLKAIMVNAFGGDIRRELSKIDAKRNADHKDGKYKGPWVLGDDGEPVKGEHGKYTPAPANMLDLRDKDGKPYVTAWNDETRRFIDGENVCQALLDEKYARYKVGESNTREAVVKDRADSIAWDIAEGEVKNVMQGKGLKIKPLIDAKNEEHGNEFNRLVYQRLNHPAHKERIYALARMQIESAKEAAEDDDELDIPAELRQPTAAAKAANGGGDAETVTNDEDEEEAA